MKYKVFIQEQYVDTIEAENTGLALKLIGIKISHKEIDYDTSKPCSVKLEIANE